MWLCSDDTFATQYTLNGFHTYLVFQSGSIRLVYLILAMHNEFGLPPDILLYQHPITSFRSPPLIGR